MQSPQQFHWQSAIDKFLYRKYPNETSTYLTIIRDRLLDLINRGIEVKDAPAYLKSGGWRSEFADDYAEFISEVEKEDKKDSTMTTQKDEPKIAASQVQQLLHELINSFAKAAGLPDKEDAVSMKEYRDFALARITELRASAESGNDPEVYAIILDSLDQISEHVAALRAFYNKKVGDARPRN